MMEKVMNVLKCDFIYSGFFLNIATIWKSAGGIDAHLFTFTLPFQNLQGR